VDLCIHSPIRLYGVVLSSAQGQFYLYVKSSIVHKVDGSRSTIFECHLCAMESEFGLNILFDSLRCNTGNEYGRHWGGGRTGTGKLT
jgi:hypothetical protein